MTVLGFLSFKIHGFQQQYKNNGYRTEIRMVDVVNYSWPEVKICNASIATKEKLRAEHLYCYKNQTLRRNKISNCTFPENYDITVSSRGTPRRKVKNTNDYWYPTACVRLNLSELVTDSSEDTAYLKFAVPGIKNNAFQVSVEGDQIMSHNVRYGWFVISVTETTSITRLGAPFKSNCSNGEDEVNVFPGPYTRDKCRDTLKLFSMLKRCGDVPDHLKQYVKEHYERGWDSWKNQTYFSTLQCIRSFFEEDNFPKPTLTQCPLSCREMMFKSDGEQRNTWKKSQLSLNFKFKTDRMTEVSEVPTYTSDNFFSDVGSWLGLLVGMSFLSVVEVATFLFTAVREGCCYFNRAKINLVKDNSA